MMKIILNGIGCPDSGARLILSQLLKSLPEDIHLLAFVPRINKKDTYNNCNKNIRCILLNVKYWSLYLRPLLEIIVNVVKIVFRYDGIINISNHGLCLTKNQLLYIQNQYILDLTAEKKLGGGYPNVITRFGLNTFIKHAETICVQSFHIQALLKEYCQNSKVNYPKNVVVIRPLPLFNNYEQKKTDKTFEFQFFYPASDFKHKRISLAIDSITEYAKMNNRVGLEITSKRLGGVCEFVSYLDQIPYDEVISRMNSSNAIIFTSEREALGLPLLEALNFEKPAVLPKLPYAVEIYGDAGVYFEKPEIASIVKALNFLYENYDEYCDRVKERKKTEWSNRKSWQNHWEIFCDQLKK